MISELLYLHVACYRLENVGHSRLDSRGYRQSGRATILKNTEQRASDTILPNDVFLREITITHLRYIAYVNHGPADTLYRQVVQHIDTQRIDVEIDRHFLPADLRRAAGIG